MAFFSKSKGGSRSITASITTLVVSEIRNPGQKFAETMRASEFSIVNDGPDPVFCRSNDSTVVDTGDDIELRLGEVYGFNNTEQVSIKCATGKTASIRFGVQ